MDRLNTEIPVVKDKLRAKYQAQGLNEDQIEIKMNTLDCEFCTYAFVNDIKLSNVEERLNFCLDFLKRQL
jgi:hypothetical protein